VDLLELFYHLTEFGLGAVGLLSLVAVCGRQAGCRREMREFAKANHFERLGRKLPEGLSFRRTNLHNPEIANVMRGTLRGTDMVIFTASFTENEHHKVHVRAQTVVAFPNVRGLGNRQIPPTGVSDFFVEVAGDWLILYYYARVIRKQQLADWCEKMCVIMQKVNAVARAA